MRDIKGEKIEVLGVYRVPWMEAELTEALRRFYSPGNAYAELDSPAAAFIERCVPLALFGIAVTDVDSRFRVSDFAQAMIGKPKSAAQVAYDEALLSSDGIQLIARGQGFADACQWRQKLAPIPRARAFKIGRDLEEATLGLNRAQIIQPPSVLGMRCDDLLFNGLL
jgi:hypothetical protein